MIVHSLMTKFMSLSSIFDWGMLAYFLHKEAGPLGILLSHLLHLNSLSELTTKTQVCLERERERERER